MKKTTRHIGIDFGEVHHFHDGLGEFSRQFGQHLAARANELRERHQVALHFHLPEAWHGMFGHDVAYLNVTRQQRHWHRQAVRFDLWHNLHQHIRQRPPAGCRHVITTLHDLNVIYTKKGFSLWRAMRRQVALLNRAQEIICISDHVLGDLRKHTRLKQPAHRIHNGVANLCGTQADPIPALLNQRFLFHIGRMTPNKNVAALIDLATIWPEQLFVFAGPKTGYTEHHQQEAQRRGLTNTLFLFDVNEAQKTWLYAHSAGLLFPSITEGFGLPPIEAMRFGCPVFLSRCTSLPEIGGPVATFFDQPDASHMKHVVETHLTSTAPSDEASQRTARQAWAHRFDWAHCMDQYVACYLARLG